MIVVRTGSAAAPAFRVSPGLRAILLLIALAALVGPVIVVLTAPRLPRARVVQAIPPARIIPPDVLPPVEPVRLVELTPEEARAYNADVPFVGGPNPAARPFVLRDAAEDQARATDCLAAAVLYEAGTDTAGQKAVAQVVLNRVRHPAFPKSVCGVVFEGQERSTGCQFTFTCDGALTRWSPSAAMWEGARKVAAAALAGAVYRPVGTATHYHTDWVVPYWQASLDKIARVGDHLFFRWTGWWGTPPAFNRHVEATEPAIARLAAVSAAHKLGGALDEAAAALAEADAATGTTTTAPALATAVGAAAAPGVDDGVFLVALPRADPNLFPAMAAMACGGRAYCKYLGWPDAKAVPTTDTLDPAQVAAMGFSYLRSAGLERTLWNCAVFPRTRPADCMRRQAALTATPAPAVAPAVRAPSRVPELTGVRWALPTARGTPAPPARSSPTDDRKDP